MPHSRTKELLGAIALSAALAGSAIARPHEKSAPGRDPDMQEIRDYRLNMDGVQKLAAVSEAIKASASATKCFKEKRPQAASSLDVGEKLINSCPGALAAVRGASLAPRAFLIMLSSLGEGMIIVATKKEGQLEGDPVIISPENIAFIEQNYEKLQQLLSTVALEK
jgi:hypothetical protein